MLRRSMVGRRFIRRRYTATPELIRLLLKHGADPNVQDDRGVTSLHEAVRRNKVDAVKVLLQHGADPAIRDSEGKTPTDYAREARHADILRILTERTTAGRAQTRRRGRKAVRA